MILSKVLIVHFLLALSTLRVAVALPVRVNQLNEPNNNPTSQSSKYTGAVAHARPPGLLWKLAPYFGAASILALIGSLVYFGTRSEETHNEAFEAHRKEQIRKFVESGTWENEPDFAESVTSGERQRIVDAGKADRDKLDKLKEMKVKLDKEIEKKSMDIVLAYQKKVKQVQESHVKKGG